MSSAELLVASTISLALLGVAAGFFTTQQRAQLVQNAYAESQTVTRAFTDLFSRELRMASYDPTGLALTLSALGATCPSVPQGFIEATPTRVHFKQDLNGNGSTTDTGEDVTYYLNGMQIMRQDGAAAAMVLVNGVPPNGLNFRYFNCSNPPGELLPSGSPLALTPAYRDCICKVMVTLTAQLADPQFANIQPLISAVETEVAVRNRSLVNTSF